MFHSCQSKDNVNCYTKKNTSPAPVCTSETVLDCNPHAHRMYMLSWISFLRLDIGQTASNAYDSSCGQADVQLARCVNVAHRICASSETIHFAGSDTDCILQIIRKAVHNAGVAGALHTVVSLSAMMVRHIRGLCSITSMCGVIRYKVRTQQRRNEQPDALYC